MNVKCSAVDRPNAISPGDATGKCREILRQSRHPMRPSAMN